MKTYIYEVPCKECEATGRYTILNAYNKDFNEEIVCEFCGGSGKILKEVYVPSDKTNEKSN